LLGLVSPPNAEFNQATLKSMNQTCL